MGIGLHVIEYALCAGLVAVGFGTISNVPLKAFKGCALLGALGYIARYLLMTLFDVHVIPASFIGALAIGVFASMAGRHWNTPAESIAYPALLPMNLGMYAYRTVEGVLMCLKADGEAEFLHASYFLQYNGMVYVMVVLAMVLGVTIPVHMDYWRKRGKKGSKGKGGMDDDRFYQWLCSVFQWLMVWGSRLCRKGMIVGRVLMRKGYKALGRFYRWAVIKVRRQIMKYRQKR